MPTVTEEKPVRVSRTQVESVAIIGGGASGAITADALLQEGVKNITIFERRNQLGGVWVLDEETIETPNDILVSGRSSLQTDPQLENPLYGNSLTELTTPKTTQERFTHTPSYRGLTTNIIEQVMTFSDLKKWDVPGQKTPEESKYVDGLTVQRYIDKYIRRNIGDGFELITGATVEDVERIEKTIEPGLDANSLLYKYKLTVRKSKSEHEDLWFQRDFDAVVVASGHYHVPHITDVPGLAEVQSKFPKVVQHAKFFRDASVYKDKTVIVVGSRASGADLSKLIARAGGKVYQSIRTVGRRFSIHENIIVKPVISKYVQTSPSEFDVVFDDGTKISNPDHVIYGTGYDWSYPFLNRLTKNSITANGVIVPDLFEHTFYIDDPLINFVGVPVDGISFRVFEYQAVLVSRFITGKIGLPSRAQQREWCRKRLEQKGFKRAYHTIGVVDALEYLNGLVELGRLPNEKGHKGRPFPELTEEDVAEYRAAGENLAKFWNEI